MVAKANPPGYVYHGSPKQLSVLEPRSTRGVGVGKYRQTGIYASSSRTFALAFALPILPDAQGELAWRLVFQADQPRIKVQAGQLDEEGIGYIYTLAADSFEALDDHQWISYTAVEPVSYEVIEAKAYVTWIEYIGHI